MQFLLTRHFPKLTLSPISPGALIRGEKNIFLGIIRYPEIFQAALELSMLKIRRSSPNLPIFLREWILGRFAIESSHEDYPALDAHRVGNQGEPKTRIKRSHGCKSIDLSSACCEERRLAVKTRQLLIKLRA